jgi:hypothetical protein
VDRLEPEMSSSEILAALFGLGLAREGEAVAGEEFCEEFLSFQPSALSEAHEYKVVMRRRNLKVWKEAMAFRSVSTRRAVRFPEKKIYGLTSQERRAAASFGANIAETMLPQG